MLKMSKEGMFGQGGSVYDTARYMKQSSYHTKFLQIYQALHEYLKMILILSILKELDQECCLDIDFHYHRNITTGIY